MIDLGSYNCVICHTQLSAVWANRAPPKWIIKWSELGGNKDVNTLAEYVCCRDESSKFILYFLIAHNLLCLPTEFLHNLLPWISPTIVYAKFVGNLSELWGIGKKRIANNRLRFVSLDVNAYALNRVDCQWNGLLMRDYIMEHTQPRVTCEYHKKSRKALTEGFVSRW